MRTYVRLCSAAFRDLYSDVKDEDELAIFRDGKSFSGSRFEIFELWFDQVITVIPPSELYR